MLYPTELQAQKAPYFSRGHRLLVLSGAGGELVTNVGAEKATGAISRDKSLISGLIDTLIGIGAPILEYDGQHTTAGVVGCFLEEVAIESSSHFCVLGCC